MSVTVAVALFVGIAPAFAARVDPMMPCAGRPWSHGDGRSGQRPAGRRPGGAVAVLVVAAGLLVKSFTSLLTLDTGFDRHPCSSSG